MDVIRAMAIIAVVLIHVSATILYRSNVDTHIYNASMFVNQLARFSVPAFILISGIGLSISYKKEQGYFKFIWRRFSKIIPSYIIWCIIYSYFIRRYSSIHGMLNDMFYGKVFYHFYFVPLIVQFYLIFPFVYKFIGSRASVIISFIITTTIIIFTHYYIMSNEMSWFLDKKNLLDWIFYFSFGAFIGNNIEVFLEKVRKYRRVICILLILSICQMMYEVITNARLGKDIEYITNFLRPSILVYTILLILFMFSIDWKDNIFMKFIKYISDTSYSIYLSHAMILYFFTMYSSKLNLSINSFRFGISAFIVTFLVPIMINEGKKFL